MDERERVPCPDCGELIVRGAKVCRFCGLGRKPAASSARRQQILALLLFLLVAGACLPVMWAGRASSRGRPDASQQRLMEAEHRHLKHLDERIREADERERQRQGG